MGAVHHTIATSVYKSLHYDFQKDFAPVTTVALVPNVLVVNAATPAKSVAELVALAKAQPGKLTYGSNGNGTAQHLIGTQFQNSTGTELIHASPHIMSWPASDILFSSGHLFLRNVILNPRASMQRFHSSSLARAALSVVEASTSVSGLPSGNSRNPSPSRSL